MLRCLWYRNTPSPTQEVGVRVSTASQPDPSPGRADSLSQTIMSWYVLMFPKIVQDKYYFNSLPIWGGVACPDFMLHKYQIKESDNYQNKESDSCLSLSLWSSPPLYDSPIKQTNMCVCVCVCGCVWWDRYFIFSAENLLTYSFWKIILQYVSIFIKKAMCFDLMASRKLSKWNTNKWRKICLFTQMYVTTLFIIELILKEYECVNWKNII